MRFRIQILLAFVPIFVLLGASGEAVRAMLETRELRWGLGEEASSLAVSIAEFLRGRPWAVLSTGGEPPSAGRAWEESLNVIVQRGQARRLYLLGPDGRQLMRRFGAAPVDEGIPQMTEAVRSRLSSEPWAMDDMVTRGGETTLAAYARLQAAQGNTAGYLIVEIGAEEYLRALASEKRRIATGAVISLLAGLVAVGLIIVPVTRGAKDLRISAERALDGHPLTPPSARFIREIVELGETFGTMGTLLNEAMDKARRILVENEQLRTPADLAATFRARFSPPTLACFPAVELAVQIIGQGSGGAFAGCRRIQETVWAFAGEVQASDELQQATLASAARVLLEDGLARLSPEAAFAEAAEFLPLAEWECVAWPLRGGAPRRWTGKAGLADARAVAMASAPPTLCLHTLGRRHQRIVDACLEGFSDLPAAEIAERLANLIEAGAGGAAVIFRHTAPPLPVPSSADPHPR